MYDDEYEACARTHATLLIYPGEIDPAEVTERLAIEPSSWQRQGEFIFRARRRPRIAPLNGWFLKTEGHVESRDSRRHIDWLLDRLAPKAEAVASLMQRGCRVEICCFWISQSGNGGPTLPPTQMKRLADLDIELWFDFYGPFEDDDEPGEA